MRPMSRPVSPSTRPWPSAGTPTHRLPDLLLGLAVPALITIYMLKFSKSYPDRVTHAQDAPSLS
jgi:hypothetical protein